ncbi:MAG: AarF/ABC1/UbiB kinase family protein, partial [Clostridia bacterium]|nr:AarF/ABC1/UbiB kinase family protein [Clostridia bacterium]
MASRRQLARYRQVANALARHGFGYLVEEAGLADLIHWRYRGQTGPELVHGRGQRVRRLLEELGPTFVKLGQLLSTRPDLIPPDILAEIARLQDQVPPFPFDLVRAVIEEELKATLDRVFAAFEPKPLAAASIGQVHRARLRQGPEVVVKVQRPGIRELVDADLAILADLARLVDARSRLGKVYRFRELVAEFQRTLYAEMDFTGEARTAQAFRRNFQGDPTVVIPQVYLQFTTRRVLTLEYIGGVNLNRYMQAPTPPQERRRVAETIVRAMLRQFLEHGLFHADPHPGNILVQGPDRVAFLDFGMVGRLSDATREQFVGLVISLIRGDSDGIVAALLSLGLVPARLGRPPPPPARAPPPPRG